MKISITSNSKSFNGSSTSAEVTSPSGVNLSPTLNECPGLAISNFDISNSEEEIPTEVCAAPTVKLSNRLTPVVVVFPIPSLETPLTGTFS